MRVSGRILLFVSFFLVPLTANSAEEERTESVGDLSQARSIVIDRALTEPGRTEKYTDQSHVHGQVSGVCP